MTDAIDYGYGETEPECAAPEEAQEEGARRPRIRKVLSARRLTGIHTTAEEKGAVPPPGSRGGKKKKGKNILANEDNTASMLSSSSDESC
jgi:hypothetical protein